jgi:recombination protein RecA
MTDRAAAVEAAMSEITKNFGAGSVMKLGDAPPTHVGVIPTGSISLDRALGIGGYPRGRIVEIFGAESAGKSTLALHAVANAQREGIAAYIDAEHSLDPEYGKALGVDVDALIVSQPDTGEQALEIVELLVKSGGVDLVVIDSVSALVPRAELENDYGSSNVGLHARLMSQAMRKLTGLLHEHQTCAIFVNQLRALIQPFGPSETTTGGRALRYYSSIRMDCRRIETEKTGDEATGNRTRVKVVKNKTAAPHRVAEFSIEYGLGISRERELLDFWD